MSLKGLLSLAGGSNNSNFQCRSPPKMQNESNKSLSLALLTLFLYLWLPQSVSHCVLRGGGGQVVRHLAFGEKKCDGEQSKD